MGRAIEVDKRLMNLELEVRDLKKVVSSLLGKEKRSKDSEKRVKDDSKKEFRESPSSSAAYFPYKERKKEQLIVTKLEITCIECGDKFDRYTGDMDERTCLTCVLKEEDPDVINKGPNLIKQRVDREDYKIGWKEKGVTNE